jgi:hypothetical protein
MSAARWKRLQILYCFIRVFGNGLAPKRFLTPFKFRSSRRLRNLPINGLRHTCRSTAWIPLEERNLKAKSFKVASPIPKYSYLMNDYLFIEKEWGLPPFSVVLYTSC